MSDIPGRLYRLAKSYLNAAKERLDQIDAKAQDELSRSLTHDDLPSLHPVGSDDPMERAQAKINAARQAVASRREAFPAQAALQTANSADTTSHSLSGPLVTAYKIIGIPTGSDWVTVQQAVLQLRERCSPTRFPDGSQEQAEAQEILNRVEEAYQVLKDALDPTEGRFDKLEL